MLDIKKIRENPKGVEEAIRSKGVVADLRRVVKLDEDLRKLIKERDDLRAEQNRESEKIPRLEAEAKAQLLSRLLELKQKIETVERQADELEQGLGKELRFLPNPPLEGAPVGKDERDNRVILEIGQKPTFDFAAKDYLALAEALGIIDVARAGKVSGSRFGYVKGDAALLEFALLEFGLGILANRETLGEIVRQANVDVPPTPFIPVIPPVLVRPKAMDGMGYVERGGDEIYHLEKDDLYLIGTSEQAIGPMHMDEIFEENDLPRRYVGFSSCFRREAGSYGKDTRGILRVHQFDKLEMFSFTRPEDSVEEHRFLLACEEYLMQQLKLPYRVVEICTGDLGDPAAAKYDIEAWLPGQPSTSSGQGNGGQPFDPFDQTQGRPERSRMDDKAPVQGLRPFRAERQGKGQYRETHSTSNTTDFQARRLNIRYRTSSGQIEFVHMLNGTAFAMGRMIIAILENYQTREGKIRVPEVLERLMHKSSIG